MKKKSENNLSVILLAGITALFFACENLEIGSNDGEMTGNHGPGDCLIVKIN